MTYIAQVPVLKLYLVYQRIYFSNYYCLVYSDSNNLFSTVLEAGRSKVKAPADLGSGE